MQGAETIDDVPTLDAAADLEALVQGSPDLFRVAVNLPNARISEADGMFGSRNAGYYFSCGMDAARRCVDALDRNGFPQSEVGRILDYACGFGRVGRALQACFPDAELMGVDVDPKAIAHYGAILGVETAALAKDEHAAKAIEGPFDLIWVGSLFTHLPQYFVSILLRDLGALLSARGVLAFTLHGDYVIGRLESGLEFGGDVMRVVQRDYGLGPGEVREVVAGFRAAGFGFAPYPGMSGYGISATAVDTIREMIAKSDLRLIVHLERGWVRHQDFCAVGGATA